MQNRKLTATILAILAIGIIAPAAIPRGHADDNSENIVSTGYLIKNNYDPLFGTVNALKAGSTLSITVGFSADSSVPARNVSIGIKFDWMNSYQNMSSQTVINANQLAYLTLNFTIPNLTGQYASLNLSPHQWSVQVWNYLPGKTWTMGCGNGWTEEFSGFRYGIYEYLGSCHQFNDYNIAIYNSQQASSMLARQQAIIVITTLQATLGGLKQAPPGSSSAIALLSQASVQLSEGDTAYSNGDFNGAQSNYQNALNNANSAQSSLAVTGGGTDTATMTSIWIDTAAILFGGIGALLVGISGFKYLRGKARTIQGYSPSAPKA